jgi:hypothetical protein
MEIGIRKLAARRIDHPAFDYNAGNDTPRALESPIWRAGRRIRAVFV